MKLKSTLAALGLGLAVSAASATPSLFFLIDGDTFTQPFSITNNSTAGERVTRFQLDISPAGMVWDPVDLGPPGNGTAGTPFSPVGSDGATTGLVPTGGPADGATLLDLSFTGFDAGETFRWNLDIDGASGSPVTVPGNLLIGSLATIDFSDGQRLLGVLSAVAGNSDASQFVVTGITVTPASLPGTLALAGLALGALGVAGRKRAQA